MFSSYPCPECSEPIDPHLGGLCPRCFLNDCASSARATSTTRANLSDEKVIEQFPQFEISERLGVGGMGEVFLVHQPDLDRRAALKVLSPQQDHDDSLALRFLKEARVMAQLSHPNIVTLYEHGHSEDGLLYLLMEHVDGKDLSTVLSRHPLPLSEARRIARQVAGALSYAHEQGVTHRDVKPANILLGSDGMVKLADFGLARLYRESPGDLEMTMPGEVLGSYDYLAPEQRRGEATDGRTDIYSLGVTLYEMLAGHPPHGAGDFSPPSDDKQANAVIRKALQSDPQRRYATAAEFIRALERTSRPTRRGTLWILAGAVVAAAVAILTNREAPSSKGRSQPVDSARNSIERTVLWREDFTSHSPIGSESSPWGMASLPGSHIRIHAQSAIWEVNGRATSHAQLRSRKAFVLTDHQSVRFEWEIGEIHYTTGLGSDYFIELGVGSSALDPDDRQLSAHGRAHDLPYIFIAVEADDSNKELKLRVHAQNGSGEGRHSRENIGVVAARRNLRDWNGQDFARVWLEFNQVGIEAGWSREAKTLSASWSDLNYDPPSMKAFGEAVRIVMSSMHRHSGPGGHHCRSVTVTAR